MLVIRVGAIEWFDESKKEFFSEGGTPVELEHSLFAVSKWEEKYEVPFLDKKDKTPNQVLDYVLCMIVGENPRGDILEQLSEKNLQDVQRYLDKKATATFFSNQPGAPRTSEVITSELIYYWMTTFSIDWQAQYWHLNRLMTLIRVANLKSAKPKKMGRQEALARQRELNAQRRAAMGTKG